jgi:hypothetical protein
MLNISDGAYGAWLAGCGIEPFTSHIRRAGAAVRLIDALERASAIDDDLIDDDLIAVVREWERAERDALAAAAAARRRAEASA